jgi:hypothetical protein
MRGSVIRNTGKAAKTRTPLLAAEMARLENAAPEMLAQDLLKPKKSRVLLLASYCGTDNPECSDQCPCNDCLRMCNVAEVTVGLEDIVGQFDK